MCNTSALDGCSHVSEACPAWPDLDVARRAAQCVRAGKTD